MLIPALYTVTLTQGFTTCVDSSSEEKLWVYQQLLLLSPAPQSIGHARARLHSLPLCMAAVYRYKCERSSSYCCRVQHCHSPAQKRNSPPGRVFAVCILILMLSWPGIFTAMKLYAQHGAPCAAGSCCPCSCQQTAASSTAPSAIDCCAVLWCLRDERSPSRHRLERMIQCLLQPQLQHDVELHGCAGLQGCCCAVGVVAPAVLLGVPVTA
jgi:hypothetical protein